MQNTREIAKAYRLSHWAQIMQERVQSGLTIKEYCRQLGICGNTYFYWQRKLREAACEGLSKFEPAQGGLTQAEFAEVTVYEPQSQRQTNEAEAQLRIQVSGVQITADSTYPAEKLAALLRELSKPC